MNAEELEKILIGQSEQMQNLRAQILQVAQTDATVLVWGESGTGKELVSQGIHLCSQRHSQNIVPLNCGAVPKDLIESELFGHEKGSFSGAIASRIGRFELAHKGTLFLDEVGEMSPDMQVKLLRTLQERTIQRVGGGMPINVDTRIVAATNRCLETAVETGLFREDLFYRLNVYPIVVPPLRQRGEDVIELFDYLARNLALKDQPPITLSGYARVELLGREWPGNVRELSNLVERLSIRYPGQEITLEMLPPTSRRLVKPLVCREVAYVDDSAKSSLADHGDTSYAAAMFESQELAGASAAERQALLGDVPDTKVPQARAVAREMPSERIDLKEHLKEIEVDFIKRSLSANKGNVTVAAEHLGLRRTTLIEKIKKYGIEYRSACPA